MALTLTIPRTETDLFNWRDRYPNQPAARATDTSRAAAESVKLTADVWRQRCLEVLAAGAATADEVAETLAARLKADARDLLLTVRPRISELRAAGKVADSGLRRMNKSGHKAIVWARIAGATGERQEDFGAGK